MQVFFALVIFTGLVGGFEGGTGSTSPNYGLAKGGLKCFTN